MASPPPDPEPPAGTGLQDELERMGLRPPGPAAEADDLPEGPAQAPQPRVGPLAGPPPGAPAAHAPEKTPSPGEAPSPIGPVRTAPEAPGDPQRPFPRGPAAPAGRHAGPGPGLTAAVVLRPVAPVPDRGWRRLVHAGTLGLVSPGPSAASLAERDLVSRASRPVPGCWRVAVLSLKGGVGKTTTTAALGVQLATLRGDRIVAIDANPDRGTLAEKLPEVNPATVRDLLRERHRIGRYSDVRAFTSLSPSRLEVLASDADPTASQAFSEDDYRETVAVLERFYSLILTDCGTGLLHSAMTGVLGLADALVVVTSPSLDGARSASATLDWLEAHGYADLVGASVAVVSSVRPRGGLVDIDAVEDHFASRCRAVVRVPYDRHLEAGATVALDDLDRATRQAYLRLAAAVGDGLPQAAGNPDVGAPAGDGPVSTA